MITLNELYTDPRFKKMSVEELATILYRWGGSDENSLTISDWQELPGIFTPEKAQKLFERLHAMDNTIRLTEGMGVKDATLEQQKLIIGVAEEKGIRVNSNSKKEIINGYIEGGVIYTPSLYGITRQQGQKITTPVTFAQFIQAILNEPEKPKEVVVKMVQSNCMGYDALVTKDGLKLNGFLFPLSVIDSLAAAKKEVEQ